MKKILVLVLMVLTVSVFADYAYKMQGGKVCKFKVIPSGFTSDYAANGWTVSIDKIATEKAVGADVFARYDSISPAERILTQSIFKKLDIRRAMRAMKTAAQIYTQDNQETTLDTILESNPTLKKDWTDSTEINLDDPLVRYVLELGLIDADKVKLKILELQK